MQNEVEKIHFKDIKHQGVGMRVLSSLMMLLVSQVSLAGYWIPTGSYVNSATEIKGITKIVNNFPVIMDGRDFTLNDIRSLQVSLIDLVYEGETTCPVNDERLKLRHLSYFICLKNQTGPCIDYFDDLPTDEDPCL